VNRVSTRIPNSTPWERLSPHWPTWVPHLPPIATLPSRELGERVTDHRSSWVRRLSTPLGDIFLKTYEYKSWASRFRDFGKRTGPWAEPRTGREFDALQWLWQHGLPAPTPLAALVWRRLGFVWRTTLITTAFPGQPASECLPALGAAERIGIGRAIGTLVGRLHALGFRDRNLDLRNLLVARDAQGWHVAKIDSPRYRLVAPGNRDDHLARADWRRLEPQLQALGGDQDLVGEVRAAARAVHGASPGQRKSSS
jgi:hypothetical protein